MDNMVSGSVQRVGESNYHLFDDMVAWRIIGKERTENQKEKSRVQNYDDKLKELDHEGFYVYAAEVMGKFVGWISLMYIPKIGPWSKGFVYVDEIWTAPDYRKKGIAVELMKQADELQKELGAVGVRLYTSNEPAQKLFEKCEYEVQGDCVFMSK